MGILEGTRQTLTIQANRQLGNAAAFAKAPALAFDAVTGAHSHSIVAGGLPEMS